MTELIVIIDNNAGTCDVHEEYTLDVFVQDLVKREVEERAYHYSGDEYLEGYDYLMKLSSYYIKAKGTALEYYEVKEMLDIINDFYVFKDVNQYEIEIVNVNDCDMLFCKKMIKEIGLKSYLGIQNNKQIEIERGV
ncbi:hypothetical protein [Mammaliicoccus vitulinus]|uniref:hypothetical protein n=1 Tax=Mammaliicoccus vitulinus TaxID=71237 RepID=UPI00248AFF29|nr:hypothetical protein [Mammaliicoccus vitulinus]